MEGGVTLLAGVGGSREAVVPQIPTLSPLSSQPGAMQAGKVLLGSFLEQLETS